MLRSFNALRGFTIRASDGHFGVIHDLYFDDTTWRLRYCVVDTGRWFGNRYVLIGPRALSVLDTTRRELWVRLSKSEIGRSPAAESDRPVSKQRRSRVLASLRGLRRQPTDAISEGTPDRHLRSCRAVIGHRLDATDGTAGRVDDFMIDDKSWVIRPLAATLQDETMLSH